MSQLHLCLLCSRLVQGRSGFLSHPQAPLSLALCPPQHLHIAPEWRWEDHSQPPPHTLPRPVVPEASDFTFIGKWTLPVCLVLGGWKSRGSRIDPIFASVNQEGDFIITESQCVLSFQEAQ